jgi:hypothetical protein
LICCPSSTDPKFRCISSGCKLRYNIDIHTPVRFLPSLYRSCSLNFFNCFPSIFCRNLMLFTTTRRCWYLCQELKINQQPGYASTAMPSFPSFPHSCRPSYFIVNSVIDQRPSPGQVRNNLCMFFCLINRHFLSGITLWHQVIRVGAAHHSSWYKLSSSMQVDGMHVHDVSMNTLWYKLSSSMQVDGMHVHDVSVDTLVITYLCVPCLMMWVWHNAYVIYLLFF